MARASFIIKKDGRYWFQKRFALGRNELHCLPSHCRIALRTSDYRVALSRMLKVMSMLQAYENQNDLLGRANLLMKDMRRFNAKAGGFDSDELVERRMLETLVSRFITEARLRNHPLTKHPEDFWSIWMSFVNGNVAIEENLSLAAKLAAPAPNRAPGRKDTSVSAFEETFAAPPRHNRR